MKKNRILPLGVKFNITPTSTQKSIKTFHKDLDVFKNIEIKESEKIKKVTINGENTVRILKPDGSVEYGIMDNKLKKQIQKMLKNSNPKSEPFKVVGGKIVEK